MNESQRRAFSALGIGPSWRARSAPASAHADAPRAADARLFVLHDEGGRWLFVGEAFPAPPDEVRAGHADPARLLDRMLAALGLRAADGAVHVPPAEAPQVLAERIDALAPFVVVALGAVAAQSLLGTGASFETLRGRVHEWRREARSMPLVVTLHPCRLVETPQEKADAWADLCLARSACEAALSACSAR